MDLIDFVELVHPETYRKYTFPGDEVVELKDVVRIAVSKSGTHRLETADGKKHIVPTGWLHIEFEATAWTF